MAGHHVHLLVENVLVVEHLAEHAHAAAARCGKRRRADAVLEEGGERARIELLDPVGVGIGHEDLRGHRIVVLDRVHIRLDARIARIEVLLEGLEVVVLHLGEHVGHDVGLGNRVGIGRRRIVAAAIASRVTHRGREQARHVEAALGDGERVTREGVFFGISDVVVHAACQGQNRRDADNADRSGEGGEEGAPFLGHQVVEGQAEGREEGHARLLGALLGIDRRGDEGCRLLVDADTGGGIVGVAIAGDLAVGKVDDAGGVFLG